MGTLYHASKGLGFLLYENGEEIILRKKDGHQFFQPVVLVRDYQEGLQDTVYNGSIYYTYISQNRDIVVRSILEYVFPFELHPPKGAQCKSPFLLSYGGRMLLLYLQRKEQENEIHIVLPYENGQEILILPVGEQIQGYRVFPAREQILLIIWTKDNTEFVLLSREMEKLELMPQSNCKQSESEMIKPLKGQILELESRLMEKERRLSELENMMEERDSELTELKGVILEREKAIAYYKGQIQSAATQYEELMEVARKYKEEAAKWGMKLYRE